jgi:dTDP-4-dehydrorhamnose reductase
MDIDWTWISRQLQEIRSKNIEPIAGLVHHGSGPAFTNLLDKNFPYLLAAYAKQVAEKFPWINYYTPVNEPLTTARFSGLYGLWYPHHNNAKSYITMLLNELKGIVLSMQEIRKINPEAKLVQTEDLGKTYSTEKLQYQADFENERRWLTYDILCGRFDQNHFLWKHFQDIGIAAEQLDFFLEHPCKPDVFGFNHYLTSERFLDDRLSDYPSFTHGGNGRHQYADVEAVRVNVDQPTGISVLLQEAWERYHQPMAVTEVHLHCHREEQLRWFKHVWENTLLLREKGIDVKAVTSWAMLGSYGWNKLLTKPGGEYEPGVFDLRGGYLRPTALATFIRELSGNNQCRTYHLLEEKGWWQRDSRLIYGSCVKTVQMSAKKTAPVLIIGKNGTLGKAFAKICEDRSINYWLVSRNEADISEPEAVERLIEKHKPWAVINAAGYVRVDEAETDTAACHRDNSTGPLNLAQSCRKHSIQLINFSSDLVFDGKKLTAYVESDLPNPLNVYGRTKAQAELDLQKEYSSSLIIRTSAFFGPWDEYNFVHAVRRALSQYETFTAANDLYISPTYVPHLVNASLDILIDREKGIWHLANKGSLTWAEFAQLVARQFDLDASLIVSLPSRKMNFKAKRPLNSVLESERGQLLPSLESAMEEYFRLLANESRKVA